MARIKEIVQNKLYVGYDYLDKFYYVIHRDTTTARLTADEAYEIAIIISPSSASSQLLKDIKALATTTETVEHIYYALEDTGIGTRAVWFNTYKDYAILFLEDRLMVLNTDIIFLVNKQTIKNKVVNSIQYFLLSQIGLSVSSTDLGIIYDYLLSTYSDDLVFNEVAERVEGSSIWGYNNILKTSGKSRVNYTATYNPEDKYSYTEVLGSVDRLDVTNQNMNLINTPASLISGDKMDIKNAVIYGEGTNYSDDGVYTVGAVTPYCMQDQTNGWFDGTVYSTAYNNLSTAYEEATENKSYWLHEKPNFYLAGGGLTMTDDAVVSGFGIYQYVRLPYIINYNNKFEIKFHIKTGNTVANDTLYGSYIYRPMLRFVNGKLCWWLSSNNTSWNLANGAAGSYTYLANTEYWIKFSWDKSTYKVEYSLDDVNYSVDKTLGSTAALLNAEVIYGKYATETNTVFTGSMYMKDFYIKLGDNLSYWWEPYQYIYYRETEDGKKIALKSEDQKISYFFDYYNNSPFYVLDTENSKFKIPASYDSLATPSTLVSHSQIKPTEAIPYDYKQEMSISSMSRNSQTITLSSVYNLDQLLVGTKINVHGSVAKTVKNLYVNSNGSLLNDNGVLSNFSTANYADIMSLGISTCNSWEFNLKFKVNSSIGTEQSLLCDTGNTYPFLFRINGSVLKWWLSSNGSSWDIANAAAGNTTLVAGKDYWVRLRFTGSQYIASLSTDGELYNNEIVINSPAKVNASYQNKIRLGASGTAVPLTGSIDLKECNFIMNDKLSWSGVDYNYNTSDGVYTVLRAYTNNNLQTEIITYETIPYDFKADAIKVAPIFSLHNKPEAKRGVAETSIMLNVTDSTVPTLFPTGEFLLDNTTQLTNYLERANVRANYIIPVPSSTNYSRFNSLVPSSTPISGLSKPLEFKGTYSELFKD